MFRQSLENWRRGIRVVKAGPAVRAQTLWSARGRPRNALLARFIWPLFLACLLVGTAAVLLAGFVAILVLLVLLVPVMLVLGLLTGRSRFSVHVDLAPGGQRAQATDVKRLEHDH